MKKKNSISFDITFQGKDTTIYIERVDLDLEVEEETLIKLTKYLIGEGFIDYSNDKKD